MDSRNDELTQMRTSLRNLALYLQLFEENREDCNDPVRYNQCANVIDAALREPKAKATLMHDIICNFAAVREMVENLKIEKKISNARSFYYPELDALMTRLCPLKD